MKPTKKRNRTDKNTLDHLCNEACRRNLPLLARRGDIIEGKWSEPPRPNASFGLINDWVKVGAEINGTYTKLLIPFQAKQLGWVKQETLRLFRFNGKNERFEKVEYALLHPKYPVIYATIDREGTYGIIGLHSHPLVGETIRLLCELKPVLRSLPTERQAAFRDRVCDLMLCAPDMNKFLESRDQLAELAKNLEVDIPSEMPPPLSRLAGPGETICDRCHGLDVVDFPDCYVTGPLPKGPCRLATWENVGPKHISGAIRQLVIDPTDRRRLYAVSNSGGIWKLDNVDNYPNEVWQPLTDHLPNAAGHRPSLRFRTMAVAPSDNQILYAANSVKELGISIQVYSEIYRSYNQGSDWPRIHQSGMGVVHRIVVDPANPNLVFAASSTGLWQQSVNTIGTWTNLFVDDCLDVALDPDDSSIVYLGVRGKGLFKRSGSIWSTQPILPFNATTAGNNRQAIKIALGRLNKNQTPQTSAARTVVVRFGNEINVSQTSGDGGAIAWHRAVPPTILVSNPDPPPPQIDGVPGFLEGGNKLRSDTNPVQSNEWNNCLAVDPFNPDHILVASDGLLESTDGGKNWTSRSSPHEDNHSLLFDEDNRGVVYITNDGGVFSSVDGGTSWPTMGLSEINPTSGKGLNFAMGLVTSEFRHSVVRNGRCVAAIDHSGFILSENFDDRWQFLFSNPDKSGRHAHEGSFIFSCPGSLDRYYIFNLRKNDDPTKVIGRLAQIDFTRTNGRVDPPTLSFLSTIRSAAVLPSPGIVPAEQFFPEDSIYNRNFPGPFAIRFSEANNTRLILFATVDTTGTIFNIQSLQLATNGTTVTATNQETANSSVPFCSILFVPNDPDRAFAIDQNGQLFERDFSVPTGQFAAVDQWVFPTADHLFVSDLIAVMRPHLQLYALSQSAIGRFDDERQNWTTVCVWPDPNERLMALAEHPERANTLFLGTNRGVYVSDGGGADWRRYRVGMPGVPVTRLSFDQGYLYAATFGRGLWRCKPCPS